MPVVMGAGGSGILLHEAIGHAFEADFNRKKTSIFCNLLGKKVCNEHINVVDDGTIPFNRGSVNFDDEGIEGQKTYIVKECMLTSYLHDRISAKHYGCLLYTSRHYLSDYVLRKGTFYSGELSFSFR